MKRKMGTYISVKLADKAWEIVVLEIVRQQILGEIRSLPNHKSGTIFVPRYHIIGARIIHKLIRLSQKRRRNRPLRHFLSDLHPHQLPPPPKWLWLSFIENKTNLKIKTKNPSHFNYNRDNENSTTKKQESG